MRLYYAGDVFLSTEYAPNYPSKQAVREIILGKVVIKERVANSIQFFEFRTADFPSVDKKLIPYINGIVRSGQTYAVSNVQLRAAEYVTTNLKEAIAYYGPNSILSR